MASTITNFSENINTLYPIAGVDNDTQGFRDNFTNIKNALGSAADEINNLAKDTASLFQSLTYSTTVKDFTSTGTFTVAALDGSVISNVQIGTTSTRQPAFVSSLTVSRLYEEKYNLGTATNQVLTVIASSGSFQTLVIDTTNANSAEITLNGWPATGTNYYTQLAVEIKFVGTPTNSPVQTAFRNQCTTYGGSSTFLTILDEISGQPAGTSEMYRGMGIYDTSSITQATTPKSVIDQVLSSKQLLISPPSIFTASTNYYFAPYNVSLPYKITFKAPTGSALLVEDGAWYSQVLPTTGVNVAHFYSYDGGRTIYIKRIERYSNV